MSNITSISNFEIVPLNQSSGNNSAFSYRNGNPLISIRIPAINNYLITSSLRLNYVLKILQPNGDLPTNSLRPTAAQVLISDRIGSNSIFDSISVSTSANNSIEQCRNYGRLLASTLPATSGFNEYSSHLTHWFGGICSSNLDVTAKVSNRPIQCSSPLLTGVLGSNQNIPLASINGIGGMIITIQLNSNNQALFSSLPAMVGAYYEISQVSLTGKYGNVDGGILPPISSIRFSAYQSYYSVINTNDHTESIDCRLGAVSSVWSNFCPTTSIQNFNQDSYQTTGLANATGANYDLNCPIRTINFLRAGQKFPLQFQIDETSLRQSVTAVGPSGQKISGFDSLRQNYFQDAVRLSSFDIDSLAGARSEGLLAFFNNIANDSPTQTRQTEFDASPLLGRCFGIGVRYDISGIGSSASFKSSPYSYRITSELDGVSPNSIYTFFMYSTILTMGMNGSVDVSS